MANYRLFKSQKTVRIPAYMESTLYYDCVTAEPILKDASYRPIWLLVPAELQPEDYESIYGQKWIRFSAPDGYRFDDGEPYNPAIRLETECIGGKTYAYRDSVPDDYYDPHASGWRIRIRMGIEDRDDA